MANTTHAWPHLTPTLHSEDTDLHSHFTGEEVEAQRNESTDLSYLTITLKAQIVLYMNLLLCSFGFILFNPVLISTLDKIILL